MRRRRTVINIAEMGGVDDAHDGVLGRICGAWDESAKQREREGEPLHTQLEASRAISVTKIELAPEEPPGGARKDATTIAPFALRALVRR